MNRTGSFLLGVIVGAVGLGTAMNYHVVRTDQGTHLIPKTDATLHGTYADIRHYQLDDWRSNPALAQAMINANREAGDPGSQRNGNALVDSARTVLGTILRRD